MSSLPPDQPHDPLVGYPTATPPPAPPTPAPPGGEPLGSEYTVFELLGRGAMGEVHRAQTRSGEPVAVKLLRSDLANDPGVVSRFLQERTILTSLQHANIVRVRDLVAEGNRLAIVMDLVRGRDLRSELDATGTLAPGGAVSVIINVLHGLAAVHGAGVIHRDLKPENVLIDTNEQSGLRTPKITDFGISSLAVTTRGSHRTGAIGTPEYMAPELIGDGAPSRASDIYAVGVMLYELLCGTTPFQASNPLALMNKHVHQLPGRPGGLPDPLWSLLSRLLAKQPEDRPGDALQVASWLQGLLPQLANLPALPRLTEPPEGGPVPASQPNLATETITTPLRGAEPETPKKRRRILVPALVVLLVLAAAGVGGYLVLGRGGDDEVVVDPTPTPSASLTPSPSPSDVTPSITASGDVVPTEASPSPGADLTQQLPDFVGMQLADAVTELTRRGLGYTTTITYDTEKANNVVTAQSPVAGQAAGSRVALTVNRTAASQYLSDLPALDNGQEPTVGSQGISSKNYAHALSTQICWRSDQKTEWEYNLGVQHYTRLAGTAGLVDDSSRQARAQIEIFLDDSRILSRTVSLGHTQKIDQDITDGLRLRIVVTDLNCGTDNVDSYFALGDPVLLSPPNALSSP